VEGRRDGRLPATVETALYRAVQEALNNATKHAQAKRASIYIEREGGAVRCLIKDDGVGFDVATTMAQKGQPSLGLLGIRERIAVLGGKLEIHSMPGQGTEMVIMVPLEGT
jgi:two-component system sensor histidine kinase UhpB